MGDDYYGGAGASQAPSSSGMSTGLIILAVLGGICLLAVPCLGIVGAIAIPNLIEARKAGNEAAAIGALRTISTSQVLFMEMDKDGNQVADFGDLQALGQAQLIDQVLASGTKQGYEFEVFPGKDPTKEFWAKATPVIPNQTGDRYFFMDQTGSIYFSNQDFDVDTDKCKPTTPLRMVGR